MALTTLSAFKVFAGITDANAARDVLLQDLIDAASAAVENACQREFAVRSYSLRRDGTATDYMELPIDPVVAVQSVTVSGVAIPQSADWQAPGYQVEGTTLVMVGGLKFGRGRRNVAITFTAGYATTPPEVAKVVHRMVYGEWKGRDWIGVSSKSLAGETITWRSEMTTPESKAVLNNYRRVIPL